MDSNQYRVNKANAYNGWDPLKQVVLGNVFTPEFFEDIADHKLRDLMQKILFETHQDLDNIQKTLEDMGVDVVRMPPNRVSALGSKGGNYLSFGEYVEHERREGVIGIPKPCLTPRDDFITLGDKIVYCDHMWHDEVDVNGGIFNPAVLDLPFQDAIHEYRKNRYKVDSNGKLLDPEKLNEALFANAGNTTGPLKPTGRTEKMRNHTWGFWAPAVHRVGNRLIIDQEDWSNLADFLLDRYPQYEGANTAIGGHNDGSMNLPKPGLVVCSPWLEKDHFKDTLPGWDVLRIENPNTMKWEDNVDWKKEKGITNGRWWHPEAKENPDLVSFIDRWCSEWVGKAEETLFEVNMLAVNENVSLSLNYQKEVHDKLKQHGVEAVYCRFRHRNFWDGGLHCLTLDTYREGGMKDYFK